MPNLRDLLNEMKWTKDLSKAEIWIRHRGAPQDTKVIRGGEIVAFERSFLRTRETMIPYHRVLRIVYDGTVVFQR